MLRDLPRKQSQGLIVQPACSSSGYLSCPLWRRVQHLPFSSHQGSPFISMNTQSDLDISVISLNTHRCSPWDPKGVWYAQESKQSKLGKAFWVQRHGGKYWDACEEWSNVKLEQGGIFLFVFVSVSLSIVRWEFNLLLPSELWELHFRFQFYSQVWGSRDCGSNWILVGWLLQVTHRAKAGSHYLLTVYVDSICFTSITVSSPIFFKCLPLYHF